MMGAVKLSMLGGLRQMSVGGTARSLNLPSLSGPGEEFESMRFAVLSFAAILLLLGGGLGDECAGCLGVGG